jgi:O-antigen ligase
MASKPLEALLIACLILTPMGMLVIKHWMSALFFLCALLSLLILIKDCFVKTKPANKAKQDPWLYVLYVTLALPILAIFMGQAVRSEYDLAAYDSPSRFLFAIPILMVLVRKKINPLSYLRYVIPLTLILTYIVLPYLPAKDWGGAAGHLTPYFVDPLSFGRICLEFGLLSALMMNFKNVGQSKTMLMIQLSLAALVIGILLSLGTGERTGWLEIPVVAAVFFLRVVPFNKGISALLALVVLVAVASAFYLGSDTVKQRSQLAVTEITTYQWKTLNPYNSVGARISFARMGLYYFELQPWSGWGDKGFKGHINDPEISQFASQYTREFALTNGFHNEMTTNAVRSGIWGVVATLAIFLLPLIFFTKNLNRLPGKINPAFLGITFVLCELIASMSTEVLNIKFEAALNAYLLLSLIAATLFHSQQVNEPA